MRLFFFDETYLASATQHLRTTQTGRGRAFALGEILEAYFWLSLGVELGYYREAAAELLAASRFVELISASTELFRTYGYLFAPEFEARLQTSRNQRQVLRRAVDYDFVRPSQYHKWFQRALALEVESIQDERLTSFFAAIAFLAPSEIEAVLSGSATANNDFFTRLNRRHFVESFRTSLSHLESFAALDAEVRTGEDLDSQDSFVFRSRINQLTRWRLNLHNPNVAEYYLLLGNLFVNVRLGGSGLSIDAFRDAVKDLLSKWGYTHQIFMTA